jgi:D-alanyl-D-alanine carboxypeptidase
MGQRCAYGFFEGKTPRGARGFGHAGGAPGMNGDLRIFPDSGYVVAVLPNLDPPAAQQISELGVDRLPLK